MLKMRYSTFGGDEPRTLSEAVGAERLAAFKKESGRVLLHPPVSQETPIVPF